MAKLTSYQKAALELNSHIALTANAGSGKTFVLKERFIQIALDNVQLRQIVAITYTDKAAGELFNKISLAIDHRINNSDNDLERIKLKQIRKDLLSANISTIHSFCSDILKEFANEIGLDNNFLLSEESKINELFWESFNIITEEEEIREIVMELIRIFRGKTALGNVIKNLYNKRFSLKESIDYYLQESEEAIADNILTKTISLIENNLSDETEQIIELLKIINNEALVSGSKKNENYEVEELLNNINLESELIKKFKILKKIGESILTKNKTFKKNLTKNINKDLEFYKVEQFFIDYEKLLEADYSKDQLLYVADISKKIAIIYNRFFKEFEETKIKSGEIDFEDLLVLTNEILKIEKVKIKLSKRYKYFMIDEYQDTNSLQLDIFMPILDNLKGIGKLFIVGDEKQSIYMFRNADIKVFDKTKEIIKEQQGKLLNLPHSFRMAPNLALFINAFFSEIFKNKRKIFNEVEYNELICASSSDLPGSVELFENSEEYHASELIALKILEIMNNPKIYRIKDFKDIAILSRRRAGFKLLEESLNKYNIPFYVVKGTGFFQEQFVTDIKNYLSFLMDKNDDLSLVGILRSPFFLIPDNIIFLISRMKADSYFEKLLLFSNQNKMIEKVVKTLLNHFDLLKSKETSQIIRIVIRETNYIPAISNTISFPQTIANIEKLIRKVREIEESGITGIYDIIKFLEFSVEESEQEGYEPLSEELNAVQIMTIHASKGLDFPAVFVFDMESVKNNTVKKGEVEFDDTLGMLFKVPNKNDPLDDYIVPINLHLFNYLIKKREFAELKRLVYVAFTRAEKHLFINIDFEKNKPSSINGLLVRFLKSLTHNDQNFKVSGNLDFYNESDEIQQRYLEFYISKYNFENSEKFNDTKEIFPTKQKDLIIDKKNITRIFETFSATKITTYANCGYKYYLNNILNIPSLEIIPNSSSFIKKRSKIPANLKGSIIHKILESENSENNFELDSLVSVFDNKDDAEEYLENGFLQEINESIRVFKNSEIFKEINLYPNYYNELNILTKLEDFYLQGIIDKVIIIDNKAKIVDYKTDKINKQDGLLKYEVYKNQLYFYAYLVFKYFGLSEIELNLVFISAPELSVKQEINKNEIIKFEKFLIDSANNIRNMIFLPDFNHCSKCVFNFNNLCKLRRSE